MKLFLTSAGLSTQKIVQTFLEQLPQPISKNRVLIVAYAQNPHEEFYVNESKEEMRRLGFEDIFVANMRDSIEIANLGNFDVIYICGGNTFAILNKLRETGLGNFIVKQVQDGAVYIGVSAGSIIAGPSVEIAGWGSEGDKNEIGLQDLTGFHLVDVAVFPHFHEELRSEFEEFEKKVSYKIIEITDEQAVFVNDSRVDVLWK